MVRRKSSSTTSVTAVAGVLSPVGTSKQIEQGDRGAPGLLVSVLVSFAGVRACSS